LKKKLSKKNILKLIDKVLEHNYFRVTSISIIASFIILSSISHLKNSFLETSTVEKPRSIKINILNFKHKLDQIEDQTLEHLVRPGETLSEILFDLGSNEFDVNSILNSTKKIFDPRNIYQGQKLKIYYKTIINYEDNDPSKNLVRKSIISKVSLSPDPEIDMIVTRQKDGSYTSLKEKKILTKQVVKYSGEISNSLFVDGVEAGISPRVMIEMINLYGFVVDFQRDIRKGDKFEVLYEDYYDEEGEKVKSGSILFSELKLKTRSKDMRSYLYKYKNRPEYFTKNGSSIKRSLLVTPVNGARISSRFGMRRHPISGFRKKHKGLDFAAPRGTPIFSAGNGTISKKGYNKFNGNYIFINHNNNYTTVYIHMSRFARGMRKNKRVSQGQTIGYVGATGMAKGAHLHYEVKKNGVSINPAKFKGTANVVLKGKSLRGFKERKSTIDQLRSRTQPNIIN
jgi:murein DD-endopeptidase MepM/ murein hydrolase activator NlpD